MANQNNLWEVPRLWPDGECIILGGGPSLEEVDLSLLEGKRVIAVNNAYELGAWDAMLFGDCSWPGLTGVDKRPHKDMLLQWAGLKVHCCQGGEKLPGVKTMPRANPPKGSSGSICRNPRKLAWNLSSGACAINLAVHFGVKRIVLLGFDMQAVESKHNWHMDHPHSDRAKFDPYERFRKPFPDIARDLTELGVKCLNATPGSALTLFPVVSLEEVV